MTDRDPFEDVLSQFRPVGPPREMQPPPALLRQAAPATGWRLTRPWIAGGLLIAAAITVGAVWLWDRRRSSSEMDTTQPNALASDTSAGTTRPQSQGSGDQGLSRDNPVVVGGDVREPVRLQYSIPTFPAGASAGRVLLKLTVSPVGIVEDVEVVTSLEGATEAAVAAAERWVYEPLIVNGEPAWFVIVVVLSNPPAR